MTKEEIIEIIKYNTEDCMFQSEIVQYIKGFLDALCKTYVITWNERYEIIEELMNNE